MTLPTKPPAFPHQVEAVRWAYPRLLSTGGVLLNHRVGTGKTRTALGIAKALGAQRVVVLAPLVALGVWQSEIEKWWSGTSAEILREKFWGTSWENIQPPGPRVLVTNYDQLPGGAKRYGRVDALVKWDPDLVICDESHMLKSWQTLRSRSVRRLTAGRRTVLLTGTPADTPLDWYGQYKLIAPADPLWAGNYGAYRDLVATTRQHGEYGIIVTGFRPERVRQVVEQHVAPYTHVVKDVLNLPEPIETPVLHDLGSEAQRVYDSLKRDYVVELGAGGDTAGTVVVAANALVKYAKLLQVCSGFLHDNDGVATHLDTVRKTLLEQLIEQDPTLPTVIACMFTAQVTEIGAALGRTTHGIAFGTITGSTPQEARTRFVQDFQAGRHRHIILNYQAGGVAITLTSAKRIILYGLPLSSILMEQMIGRVWRAGQTGHVQIVPLLAAGTVEPVLWEGLKKKASDVDLARLVGQHL